jgi:hypothetical protein
MGHIHMIRKGIRLTKPTVNEIMNEETEREPQLDPPRHINNREHYVGVTTIIFEELKGIIATYLPGRFPTTYGQGNSYVMVMQYDFDSNTINDVAIKNRKKESLIRGYKWDVWRLTKSRNQSSTASKHQKSSYKKLRKKD